ncbi:MAG: hypothetical protein K0S47_4323 [Herbinix sp.]|jgi:hypothetical protein|nr:hypothetical protein [Herbinix sp.]
MRKKFYIIIIVSLVLIAYGGYSIYDYIFPKAKPIQYPEVKTIYSIEISSGDAVTQFKDISQIETISNYIVNAKATRKWSVNDTPVQRQYHTLSITTANDVRTYRYYMYEESSKLYIEQPYYGVYIVDKGMIDFFE